MQITTAHPNGPAPTRSGKYALGAKGGRTAQAWQHIWDRLDRTEWKYGRELAEEAAGEYDLKLSSMLELLSRMRATGVIEQQMRPVPTRYQRRKGAPFVSQRGQLHYRIADKS